MPAASTVTELGLRLVLKRMIEFAQQQMEQDVFEMVSAYLHRRDKRIIELRVVALDEDDTCFDIEICWQDNTGADDAFVTAMNQHFGTQDPWQLVASINDDLFFNGTTVDAVPKMLGAIRNMLSWELCACKRCIVIDHEVVCFACMIGATPEDAKKHMCGICFESCVAPIQKTACCKQYVHRACLSQCGTTCPFCRARPRQVG